MVAPRVDDRVSGAVAGGAARRVCAGADRSSSARSTEWSPAIVFSRPPQAAAPRLTRPRAPDRARWPPRLPHMARAPRDASAIRSRRLLPTALRARCSRSPGGSRWPTCHIRSGGFHEWARVAIEQTCTEAFAALSARSSGAARAIVGGASPGHRDLPRRERQPRPGSQHGRGQLRLRAGQRGHRRVRRDAHQPARALAGRRSGDVIDSATAVVASRWR